jgi:hypothetical protein
MGADVEQVLEVPPGQVEGIGHGVAPFDGHPGTGSAVRGDDELYDHVAEGIRAVTIDHQTTSRKVSEW